MQAATNISTFEPMMKDHPDGPPRTRLGCPGVTLCGWQDIKIQLLTKTRLSFKTDSSKLLYCLANGPLANDHFA